MRINACSVAFRHLDVTAADLARYVDREGFDGLEIWSPHARALLRHWQVLDQRPRVPMLAGYLPLGMPDFDPAEARALVELTAAWAAPRLRLFAGGIGSREADAAQHRAILDDLRRVADMAADHGLRVAVEMHPGTLADSVPATEGLLAALDHAAVGINFDVLHVWEGGADPLAAFTRLAPDVLHFHLKNVTGRDRLSVFEPQNVHDPKGGRDGMCPLFGGVLDYARILGALPPQADGSLEWFGPRPAGTMRADLAQIRALALQAA
ncbi:sugar phosphate isomerase/epimerase family protein [Paracoccus beibuensis]|uniref:sugar phosphate isomerase/epimerase family protein n=1 Tax=Paracoccus beibuensis TaxID=547602 RepID=UPI00223EA593|nr:TIM barrel protein [Paracoccus beibuensis]